MQIPIVVVYMHDLGNDRKLFGGLGPYFAYGIGGKFKGDGFSEKVFDEDFGFKRFDAGLTFTGEVIELIINGTSVWLLISVWGNIYSALDF